VYHLCASPSLREIIMNARWYQMWKYAIYPVIPVRHSRRQANTVLPLGPAEKVGAASVLRSGTPCRSPPRGYDGLVT